MNGASEFDCGFFLFQSEKHQEYEYLLKWKGYGEEENSWVRASHMNCWGLLQKYLSTHIFNKPPTSSSSSFNSLPAPQKKTRRKTKTHLKPQRRLNGSTGLTSKSNGTSKVAIVSQTMPPSQLPTSDNMKVLSSSAPKPSKAPLSHKLPLSSAQQKLKGHRRKKAPSDSAPQRRNSAALHSPSISPLVSSCDDLSSSQSDCSVSVNDSFCLYLDTDEESSSGEGRPLGHDSHSREHMEMRLEQLAQGLSQKGHSLFLSQQKDRNGYTHAYPHTLNGVKSTVALYSNGHTAQADSSKHDKEKLTVANVNAVSQSMPTSSADNADSDASESWSKQRLRKRGYSPLPYLEISDVESNGIGDTESGVDCRESNDFDHMEVTSTTSPPLPSPAVESRQSPSPEYQQELLEWQFLLNKQCRPHEAFILVENRIDEAPIPWNFQYITANIYAEGVPNPQKPEMAARLCGCTCYITGKRCGPKTEHCCPKLAGADFPYTIAGKVKLSPGNPIYECNSQCSCPPDCSNRVVQRGRKVNMCIFRTANGRGWGVKTMEPIKPNTFVTEYVGEVVTTDEAERRGQLYDKEGRTYLFDLDFNCNDNAFTIDAAHYGNISHFFNHSVSIHI